MDRLKSKILSFKKKWIVYTIIETICIILPFLIICIFNRKEYFQTKENALSLGIGFIIGLIVIIFTAVPKLPKLNGIGWYIVAVLLVWCFRMLVSDLCIIITTSFAGYVISLFFAYYARKNKNLFNQYKSALINKEVLNSEENIELDPSGKIK